MLYINRRVLSHFDFLQPLIILPIVILSYFLVSEASDKLANKQIIYFSVGFVVFVFFFLLPIRRLEWIIPSTYWLNIILLLSVDFFGVTNNMGARRWLEIPFVHFTIQPSEIMKPAFIVMVAYLIKQNPPPPDGYGWKSFFKFSFYIILPFVLIKQEPDLGTALILFLVGYGVLFVIGVNKKIWITLGVIFGLFVLIFGHFIYGHLHSYQKKRITDFISDKPSYHVKQSIIAIGSGGINGKDKNDATQTKYKFLPISTSDFIFSYYVERFGFIGALALIFLYSLLIIHLLTLNYGFEDDYFTSVITSGLGLLIFIHMSVNIAMTIGLAPVVGIPLPFFSYGGSSFITFMIMFGTLQNLLAFRYDSSYRFIQYTSK